MDNIEWKVEYEVGNFEIDAEHKIFVKIISKIQRALLEEKDMAYIDRLFLELFRYAEFHFCSEENIMIDAGYPKLELHKQEHKKLLFRLRDRLPSAGGKKRDVSGILKFLLEWFVCHTTTTDLEVAHYLNKAEGATIESTPGPI